MTNLTYGLQPSERIEIFGPLRQSQNFIQIASEAETLNRFGRCSLPHDFEPSIFLNGGLDCGTVLKSIHFRRSFIPSDRLNAPFA